MSSTRQPTLDQRTPDTARIVMSHPKKPSALTSEQREERTNQINRRVAAFAVEGAMAAPVALLLALLVSALLPPDQVAEALEAPGMIVGITLAVYLMLRDVIGGGTSLGKSALGLKVVNTADDAPAGMIEGTLRSLPWIFPPLAVLEFTWAYILDRDGRRLGDRIAGTYVADDGKTRLGRGPFVWQSFVSLTLFILSIFVTMLVMALVA